VVRVLRGPTAAEPLVARLPDQPPLAVQVLALLVLQVRDVVAPESTILLAALRLTTGAGAGGAAETVTVLDRVTAPPLPLQVNEKVVVEASGGLVSLPDAGRAPDQPLFAWQEVAFAVFQVNVTAWPLVMELEEMPKLNVGAGSGAAVTVMVTAVAALPPGPVQVSE
jgi:hypothetical protein